MIVLATQASAHWGDVGHAFDHVDHAFDEALDSDNIGTAIDGIGDAFEGNNDNVKDWVDGFHGQTGCGTPGEDNYGYADCSTNPPVDPNYTGSAQ